MFNNRNRIDPNRRTTSNNTIERQRAGPENKTTGAQFFQRRKMNEINKPPVFDNKYHRQINRNKDNIILENSDTSGSDNSTNISSEYKAHEILKDSTNPLLKAQLENIERMKNKNKKATTNTHDNNELNMTFDQLKSDKTFMKNIEQISEIFTKINGSTHSSVELIYNFKHMTNNILSYFSTISNQKDHIEDVLLKIVEHLSVIIKKKGSNDTNHKLLNMLGGVKNKHISKSPDNTVHSDTNSESDSDLSNTIRKLINSNTTSEKSDSTNSDNNIKIDTNSSTDNTSTNDNTSTSDDTSANSDSSNQSNNVINKPKIFGY